MKNLNLRGLRFTFQHTNNFDDFNILKKLKPNKAVGYDGIPGSLIIDGAREIAGPLTMLINRFLNYSVSPTTEKVVKVTQVYKSGERATLGSYRPISVLPIFSKVPIVLYQQLYDYLEKGSFLSQRQFGFRRKSSTQHAVTLFSDLIRKNMDRGKMTGAIFIDLKKAYDRVDHSRLLSKLPCYGIQNKELAIFQSNLFDRRHLVQYDEIKSDTQLLYCGVPQGSILGPLLFNLMIKDTEFVLQKSEINLHADYAVIYYSHRNAYIIEKQLNEDINQVGTWCKDSKLIINSNIAKTECVLFGTNKKTAQAESFEISMNGCSIPNAEKYEHLGVVMDRNLNLTEDLKKMIKKAFSRVKLLSIMRHNINPYIHKARYACRSAN